MQGLATVVSRDPDRHAWEIMEAGEINCRGKDCVGMTSVFLTAKELAFLGARGTSGHGE